jgi:hypothetical protein
MTALAAWSLLKRFWWAIPLAGLLLYAALEHRSATHWKAKQAATQAAFDTTVANYRAAADEAARLDRANVARVAHEQIAITEKVTHDYESKLADSAGRYDRLRAQASGYLSRAGTTTVPASPDTTCQAVAGARCEELPALLKAAQDNTDQLLALQDWVRAQSKVDVGNGSAP